MHQCNLTLGIVMQQRLLTQPVQQLIAIGGLENFAQSVAFFQAFDIAPHGQQVQVMVAQYTHQRLAHAIQKAQGFQ